jgi:flavin reductase (DIM6/NTAB) family NADH-FMN oxidoreductase RutF
VTSSDSDEPLDTSQFDAFVEGLNYPMFVVTAASEQRRAGCLVGFTTQVSIDPPRFLVCLSVKNHTYEVAKSAGLLAIHVVTPDQRQLAELFGEKTGHDTDKFAQCSWRPGPQGIPLLDDCPRLVVGRVLETSNLGDHVGFLLEPVEATVRSTAEPIMFEDVADMEPGHEA